jgi:hypothetical protein
VASGRRAVTGHVVAQRDEATAGLMVRRVAPGQWEQQASCRVRSLSAKGARLAAATLNEAERRAQLDSDDFR